MEKYELEKLRDLPIEAVAERLGLHVVRHKSLCPFHEDSHPSLSYRVSKNTCRCFVCMTQSIGPIDLVMRHLNLDFKAACRWLADEHNIILDEWKPAEKDEVQKPFDATRYERFFERPFLNDEARIPLRRAAVGPEGGALVPTHLMARPTGHPLAADTLLRP